MKQHKANLELSPETPLSAARAAVELYKASGCICPACDQNVKLYERPITWAMSVALIHMGRYLVNNPAAEFVHTERLLKGLPQLSASVRGDVSKFKFWGLIVHVGQTKKDGNPRSGYWWVTDKGFAFLAGEIAVQAKALIYHDSCFGFTGPNVTIYETLKKKFNYDEIVRRPAHTPNEPGLFNEPLGAS